MYAHKKILGKIDGKSLLSKSYRPDSVPPPEVIIGRQLSTIQQELLENPPESPFENQNEPSKFKEALKSLKEDDAQNDFESSTASAAELDLFIVELTPIFRDFHLTIKLFMQNKYPGDLSEIDLRLNIPKGLKFFRVEPTDLTSDHDGQKIEIKIPTVKLGQAMNYDLIFIPFDLNPIKIEGLIRYKNPSKVARFKKLSSEIINLSVPKFIPASIPSFEIENFLAREDIILGSRKFALFQTADPLIVYNYLKDVGKNLKLNLTLEDTDNDRYRAYFFGNIVPEKDAPEEENPEKVCLLALIEGNTMGFTMYTKDSRIIATTLTLAMKELSKRFALGGALGGELIEMICSKLWSYYPRIFWNGDKTLLRCMQK